MKYANYFIAIFAMSMLLIACDRANPNMQRQDIQLPNIESENQVKKEEADKNDYDTSIASASPLNNPSSQKGSDPDWDKKIIKTADIQLQLDDYKKFNASIHSSLKNFGAYIASEKQTENDYQVENTLTIKVPVDQFEDLVNSLQGNGIKITSKNISSADVTGEVVDTKARMLAKTAVRDKYLQLLKQAKNMNEILQVQSEINGIQEDIEAANGRINYLQHSSAYSTINLDYFQYINGTTVKDQKPGFFTKLSKAFSTGTFVISNVILFCISIWPFIIIGGILLLYSKKTKSKKLHNTKNVV